MSRPSGSLGRSACSAASGAWWSTISATGYTSAISGMTALRPSSSATGRSTGASSNSWRRGPRSPISAKSGPNTRACRPRRVRLPDPRRRSRRTALALPGLQNAHLGSTRHQPPMGQAPRATGLSPAPTALAAPDSTPSRPPICRWLTPAAASRCRWRRLHRYRWKLRRCGLPPPAGRERRPVAQLGARLRRHPRIGL